MAKKRTISMPALQNVVELQSAAMAARKAAAVAHDKDIEASTAYTRKINDLKVKVATGAYTTGDHLLDINIVVNSSVQRDERYEAMARFEKTLELHVGELVAQLSAYAGTPQIEMMGILPESPKLQFQVVGSDSGRRGMLNGTVPIYAVVPVVDQDGIALELLSPRWEGTRDAPTLGTNIIFEDKLQWILENEPNMNLAVSLWSKAQSLGLPLAAQERVTREIMIRRENCALELQGLIANLRKATSDFKKVQEDPKSWTRSQTKVDGEQVIVSFQEETGQIRRARKRLVEKVREADLLGMNRDPVSPTYENAATLLEATKEWGG